MDKSPDAFRTISEVADHLDTPAHVLRFWESRFPQIRPVKRAGGRRYYRPSDVALLAGIKRLLHDDGMTIRGVQKVLRDQGVRHVQALSGEALPEMPDITEPFMPPKPTTPSNAFVDISSQPVTAEVIPFAPNPAPEEPVEELLAKPADSDADALAVSAIESGGDTADLDLDTAPADPEPAAESEPGPQVSPPPHSGLPFLQPRVTPVPPAADLPLFATVPPARPVPASLSELRERLRSLPQGALAPWRDDVAALARRLQALLPADTP